MATTSQRARTTVITLTAGMCGLLVLAYPDWRAEAQTQRYPTRITECPTTITQPGSYILVRNLTATGDCLVVAANDVTLDLNGWVITGETVAGSGVTDREEDRARIAVRNGSVAGFERSVDLGQTSGAIVEKVRAADADAVGIAVGRESIVSGNIVQTEQATFGILAGPGSTVSGNTVDVELAGPAIRAGSGSIVSGNTISGGDPIAIAAESGSIVSGNAVRGSALGIELSGGGGIVSGNTVEGVFGIEARAGSTVSGNTVRGTARGLEVGIGIEVTCPSNVIGNTATGFDDNLPSGAGCTNIDNLAP